MRRRQYVQSHQFKSVCAMPYVHKSLRIVIFAMLCIFLLYYFLFRFSLTYYIMFCVVCQVAQTAIIVIITRCS